MGDRLRQRKLPGTADDPDEKGPTALRTHPALKQQHAEGARRRRECLNAAAGGAGRPRRGAWDSHRLRIPLLCLPVAVSVWWGVGFLALAAFVAYAVIELTHHDTNKHHEGTVGAPALLQPSQPGDPCCGCCCCCCCCCPTRPPPKHPPLTKKHLALQLFTPEQLRRYTGRDSHRIYVAVMGEVYDVTPGYKHYGGWG